MGVWTPIPSPTQRKKKPKKKKKKGKPQKNGKKMKKVYAPLNEDCLGVHRGPRRPGAKEASGLLTRIV
jgi:hypothetical protein